MPVKSLIVGVDLAPIKPIPKTITFQDDITTDRCRSTIRGHLKGWKADTVIHDGAPNVGTAWVQDAFSQNELVLASLVRRPAERGGVFQHDAGQLSSGGVAGDRSTAAEA